MTRIFLKILKNLINNKQCVSLMIDNDLINFLEIESRKNFKNEEIKNNIMEVVSILSQNYKVFSNFDKYKKELETETLVWGPCHTEQFWKENIFRFEEKSFALIKNLFQLVKCSRENETLAVALFDLGEFAKNYPHSKIFFDKEDSNI